MTLLELRPNAAKDANSEVATPARLFPQPVSTVFADLLPDEVRLKRRLGYLKRRMGFGLVALALLIGLGDALARQQTGAATDDLATANLRINALNQQAARFGQVVAVQAETRQITGLLAQAMAGDVPWAALTARLQQIAPRGLALTGVDGEIGTGTVAAPAAPTGTAGPAVVGSLSLTGTATSYQQVADYVAALGSLTGVAAVNPATTSTGGGGRRGALSFTITTALTTAATHGRYTPTSETASSVSAAARTAAPTSPPATAPTAGAAGAPAPHPAAGRSAGAAPEGN